MTFFSEISVNSSRREHPTLGTSSALIWMLVSAHFSLFSPQFQRRWLLLVPFIFMGIFVTFIFLEISSPQKESHPSEPTFPTRPKFPPIQPDDPPPVEEQHQIPPPDIPKVVMLASRKRYKFKGPRHRHTTTRSSFPTDDQQRYGGASFV